MHIQIYDTTLRDGTQGEHVSFSAEDKLRVAQILDDLGVDYIEGGWPGSNPKDSAFFERARAVRWKHSRLAAFCSTRHSRQPVDLDPNLRSALEAETPVVTIFGKSWDLHVERALRIELEENLRLIRESVAFLKAQGREVIYDAEHFFDGLAANPAYALETLTAAAEGGADSVVLCDTNGGSLPERIREGVELVADRFKMPLGIHAHNDADLAAANTLEAVRAGVRHVQGTLNGYGERCGNANLCSLLPTLELKLGYETIGRLNLTKLTAAARQVSEIANLPPPSQAPYVGSSAFAHKGGVHVHAVLKDPRTYEHLEPALVGNNRRVLLSDLSGRSNITARAQEMGLTAEQAAGLADGALQKLKELEFVGYQYEGAESSFEILLRRLMGNFREFFQLEGFRVVTEKREDGRVVSEASIKVRVAGQVEHTAAEGNGPVHALDNALRKALRPHFRAIDEVRLSDYKVRIVNSHKATAARVRVLIESTDGVQSWTTVGVSDNILEASWQALADSFSYKLFKESARLSQIESLESR